MLLRSPAPGRQAEGIISDSPAPDRQANGINLRKLLIYIHLVFINTPGREEIVIFSKCVGLFFTFRRGELRQGRREERGEKKRR